MSNFKDILKKVVNSEVPIEEEKYNDANKKSAAKNLEEELTSWAVGTQLIPENNKILKQGEPTTKRYSETKRKKDAALDNSFNAPSVEKSNIPTSPNNQDLAYDFSPLPHLQPTATSDQERVAIMNRIEATTKQLKPIPKPKPSKNLQPKWVTCPTRINIKFVMINHKNKLNNFLQKLAVNNRIKNFQETCDGVKVKMQENALVHINLKTHEISIDHADHKNLNGFMKLAKELGIAGLNISEVPSEYQFQLYKEGNDLDIEMACESEELSNELAMQYEQSTPRKF